MAYTNERKRGRERERKKERAIGSIHKHEFIIFSLFFVVVKLIVDFAIVNICT